MLRTAFAVLACCGLLGACAHNRTEPVAPAEENSAGVAETTATAAETAPVVAHRKTTTTDSKIETTEASPAKVEANNTQINARDRDTSALTPMDQSNSKPDLEITQGIRQAVVGTKGLSFTAKNVKIITRDAKVTLRGAVKSANEKSTIDALARAQAGVGAVDNQIEVEATN